MDAEVVVVGSELLLGQVVDTNSAVIARHFAAIGLNLFFKTTVGDNLGRVTKLALADLGTAGGAAERLAPVLGDRFAGGCVLSRREDAGRLGLDLALTDDPAEAAARWAGVSVAASACLAPLPGSAPPLVRAAVAVTIDGRTGGRDYRRAATGRRCACGLRRCSSTRSDGPCR